MVRDRDLIDECKGLPYSGVSLLTRDIYISTVSALKSMWKRYGYAKVLAALSQVWPIGRASAFFDFNRTYVPSRGVDRSLGA